MARGKRAKVYRIKSTGEVGAINLADLADLVWNNPTQGRRPGWQRPEILHEKFATKFPPRLEGYCYLMLDPISLAVKIGKTNDLIGRFTLSGQVNHRGRTYFTFHATDHPGTLLLLGMIPGAGKEKELHLALSPAKGDSHGEWYAASLELFTFIAEGREKGTVLYRTGGLPRGWWPRRDTEKREDGYALIGRGNDRVAHVGLTNSRADTRAHELAGEDGYVGGKGSMEGLKSGVRVHGADETAPEEFKVRPTPVVDGRPACLRIRTSPRRSSPLPRRPADPRLARRRSSRRWTCVLGAA